MAKPNKVRYSGVAVFANGYILSRVQNVSIDSDLGTDEARELSNADVVEFTSTNPQVTVSVETNEYGSCRNIRAIAGVTGGAPADIITVSSFDGTAVDICVQVEEDNILKRTCIVQDAFLTSISWNYDVGGVATESFNFESDNKTWLASSWRQAYSVIGYSATGFAGSGTCLIPISGFIGTGYGKIRQYIDGIQITGLLGGTLNSTGFGSTETGFSYAGPLSGMAIVRFFDTNNCSTSTGSRYRTWVYRTIPDNRISTASKPSATGIGSISRGRLKITLTGNGGANDPMALRLQSCSIDADMGREVLQEIGHYRAYERSLTYPVPVNVTFSALASDLEEWSKFGARNWDNLGGSNGEFSLADFAQKTAALVVNIYDNLDTATSRSLKKTITVSGLQVVSESFGVDVGGNATQDYTAKATMFIVSGNGTPGLYPLVGFAGATPVLVQPTD